MRAISNRSSGIRFAGLMFYCFCGLGTQNEECLMPQNPSEIMLNVVIPKSGTADINHINLADC